MGEMMPAVNSMSGVGKFSATELKKQLSGKTASVQPSVAVSYTHLQRIHRIDAAADAEVRRRRRRNRLALAGKQQRGILQREGLDVDLVAPPLERAGHDLHDRGQAPAIGMGRS